MFNINYELCLIEGSIFLLKKVIMISIYHLKPKFQALLKPILEYLHQSQITANQITLASILWSFFIGFVFWFANYHSILFLILPIGLFIRMALNALDGMMARTYNQQSKLGEILNEIGDIVADVAIFLPLLKLEANLLYLIVIFICLSIINEFAGILAKCISGQRRYDGPMGKSDRAFIMGLYGILSYMKVAHFSPYLFGLSTVLILISTYLRLKNALKAPVL